MLKWKNEIEQIWIETEDIAHLSFLLLLPLGPFILPPSTITNTLVSSNPMPQTGGGG